MSTTDEHPLNMRVVLLLLLHLLAWKVYEFAVYVWGWDE